MSLGTLITRGGEFIVIAIHCPHNNGFVACVDFLYHPALLGCISCGGEASLARP